MSSKLLISLLLTVLCASFAWAGMMPAADDLKAFDAMIDKAMVAYNAEDPAAFYADFAAMMAAICTPEAFKALYIDNYRKTFGDYVSRSIIEAETVVAPGVPNGLLVYEAKFSNNEKVKLAVNLFQENNIWKIQQISIQAMP